MGLSRERTVKWVCCCYYLFIHLVNEDRQVLNSVWQRKRRWIGHVLRHGGLLHEINEGRMRGKPTTGRWRIQMLHGSANDDSCVVLKRAAEDTEGWRHRQRMSKTCSTTEDYWRWSPQSTLLSYSTAAMQSHDIVCSSTSDVTNTWCYINLITIIIARHMQCNQANCDVFAMQLHSSSTT